MTVTVSQMNERLGCGLGHRVLWSATITDVLGVQPAGHDRDGFTWTEEQFQEICSRLADRCMTARAKSIEDNEL